MQQSYRTDFQPDTLTNEAGFGSGPAAVRLDGTYFIIPPTTIAQNYTLTSPTWRILGFAASARLVLINSVTGACGKWGRIRAGLTYQSPGVGNGINEASDPSLVTTLWDPATHDLPPQFTSPPSLPLATYLPLESVVQLQQPLIIPQGGSIPNVGIWMEPSELAANSSGNLGLNIFNASVKVAYDDGT